jgi:hypothetical protein
MSALKPNPDPRYSNPANSHGLMSSRSNFANGVETPKKCRRRERYQWRLLVANQHGQRIVIGPT